MVELNWRHCWIWQCLLTNTACQDDIKQILRQKIANWHNLVIMCCDIASLNTKPKPNVWLIYINVSFPKDIRCDNLSTPSNAEITPCSSGRVGVGYEGDTCSFTCNTGYELTGSDTRTCLSNGSWSGTESTCRRGMQF